jgi:hypothetical protein
MTAADAVDAVDMDVQVLIRALDERADKYMRDLEEACRQGSSHNRDSIVAKARLLVRCHEMWLEAKGETS